MASKKESELQSAFGDAVRKSRIAMGLSQEKLAEHAHIHRTYIGDVERGLRNVALVNMYRISAALDTPLSALISSMEATIHEQGKRR